MSRKKAVFMPTAALLALGTVLAPQAAGVAGAQEPGERQQPEARFEEEMAVTEVQLDVLVTDRRGNVVIGLDEDDFIVEEDGLSVEIADVTFYSSRRFLESAERAAELGIQAGAVPADRHFILFFQDPRSVLPRLTPQLLDAGRRAKQWVRSELLPNDRVAVAGYDYRLELYQDFTTDAEALSRAIDQAVRGAEAERWPSRQQPTEGPSLLASVPQPSEVRGLGRRFYGGMELLAHLAGGVPGRKNVILFSIGFGEAGAFGTYTPDSRYYPPMIQALNDNNVAVYAIDLFTTDPEARSRDNVFGNSLSSLASDTGGRYYFNFVNFLTPLEQVAEDNSGYYLISYRSRHPEGESGYQEVEVRTTNPGFRTRAREGYLYGD